MAPRLRTADDNARMETARMVWAACGALMRSHGCEGTGTTHDLMQFERYGSRSWWWSVSTLYRFTLENMQPGVLQLVVSWSVVGFKTRHYHEVFNFHYPEPAVEAPYPGNDPRAELARCAAFHKAVAYFGKQFAAISKQFV